MAALSISLGWQITFTSVHTNKICHYFRYFYIVETRKVVLAMNSLSAYHLIIRLHCSNAIIWNFWILSLICWRLGSFLWFGQLVLFCYILYFWSDDGRSSLNCRFLCLSLQDFWSVLLVWFRLHADAGLDEAALWERCGLGMHGAHLHTELLRRWCQRQ